MHSRDINTFNTGDTVNVGSLEDYQGVTITRISDGGVTVSGPKCGKDIVISGKSPAVACSALPSFIKKSSDGLPVEEKTRAARGSYTDKMNNIKLPDGNFTTKQVAELNDIPVPYATKWVKDNCAEVGKQDKAPGQRGRVASLYNKI